MRKTVSAQIRVLFNRFTIIFASFSSNPVGPFEIEKK